MMRVLLKIDGWNKLIDVVEDIANRGIIRMYGPHPFYSRVDKPEGVGNISVETFEFYYSSKNTIDNIPIFKCDYMGAEEHRKKGKIETKVKFIRESDIWGCVYSFRCPKCEEQLIISEDEFDRKECECGYK